MFGYVLPLKGELKVKEYEAFKACYCSLCGTLGKKYGLFSRFILNYDFVFMSMLLQNGGDMPKFCKRRCFVKPFEPGFTCSNVQMQDKCAGYSVILSYGKLCDSILDEKGFKRIGALIVRSFLKRAYKKASSEYPEFAKAVTDGLSQLTMLEKAGEQSIDKSADKFASILSSCANGEDEIRKRILTQIFYHIGRWIYIIDAFNDMEEDQKCGNFNAVIARYGTAALSDNAVKAEISATLSNSLSAIRTSFELLDENYWSNTVRNIIYLGMEDTQHKVLSGDYKAVSMSLRGRQEK